MRPIIDLITTNSTKTKVNLIISDQNFDSTQSNDFKHVQDKINLYLSYVLDGQLAKDFPEFKEYKKDQFCIRYDGHLNKSSDFESFLEEIKRVLCESLKLILYFEILAKQI
jgi:hypothetical protein